MKQRRKNPNAVALGRSGAKARMKKLLPEVRSELARAAVNARWARVRARTQEGEVGTE